MTRLTLELPDDVKRELDEYCRQQNRADGEVVGDLLRRFLAVQKFRELRRGNLPLAEAQGILTDEDVFRIVS